MHFFIQGWGGRLPKNYTEEEGMRKKSEIEGGPTIFKLHSSKSHQPPSHPIKNKQGLIQTIQADGES